MNINKEILKTIKYFSFFAYYPTLTEIHTFLQVKISKNELNDELVRMIKLKKILNSRYLTIDSQIHTPPQYSIGRKISKIKLENWRYRSYIKLLSLFPQIKLVGLSGSISMLNAKEDDDIDLFIITTKNRLFTGRLIALVLAQMLGLRRSRDLAINEKARYRKFFNGKQKTVKNLVSSLSQDNHKDKVCLNLFFDENNLKAPKFKQTEFVGHEVLQMKPIINKDHIYERFLQANKWVFKLFPNAKNKISNFKFLISNQFQISNFKNSKLNKNLKLKIENLGDWVEYQLKKFQLRLINKHKTSEIVTDSQLWFHPDDFEKKLFRHS